MNNLAKYNVSKATYIWREVLQDWKLLSELPEVNKLSRVIPSADVVNNNLECGLQIEVLILSIALSIVVPFFWLIVAFLLIYYN